MERFFEKIAAITKVTENEPMKKHTTFRIGGPAKYFAEPSSKEELKFERKWERLLNYNYLEI